MGLMGKAAPESTPKGPAIVIVDPEEIKRKSIKMDKHAKPVKVTDGNKDAPVDNSEADNLFLALYSWTVTLVGVMERELKVSSPLILEFLSLI